jgi:hypothetical protein
MNRKAVINKGLHNRLTLRESVITHLKLHALQVIPGVFQLRLKGMFLFRGFDSQFEKDLLKLQSRLHA